MLVLQGVNILPQSLTLLLLSYICFVGAGSASPNSVFQSPTPFGYSLLNLRGRVFLVLFVLTSPLFEVSTSISNP